MTLNYKSLKIVVLQCERNYEKDDELELLRFHCNDLKAKQKTLNDRAYVKWNNYKTGLMVIQEVEKGLGDLRIWLVGAKDGFSGRPLLIRRIMEEWSEMKGRLGKLQHLLNKFNYLFDCIVSNDLGVKIDGVVTIWKEVKKMKRDYLAPAQKVIFMIIFFCTMKYTSY
jgi:hypothetical protein